MKNLVLSRKQLQEVLDNQKTSVSFVGSNPQEMGMNAQNAYNDARSAGLSQSAIKMIGKSPRNNAVDNDEVVIGLDTTQNTVKDAVQKAAQDAQNNGLNPDKTVIAGNAEDLNNIEETKQYTKKQIEEMRINNIKKNGSVMTKQQLQEEFDSNSKFFLCDIDDPDNLQPINPIYVLRPEDIDEEEEIVYMNGVEIDYISENTNFYEDENGSYFCQPGDLVFEFNNEYAFYRKGLNECTGFVNYNAVVGTTQEVRSFIATYQ